MCLVDMQPCLWVQVALNMVRNIAHTRVTLSPNMMAGMTFQSSAGVPPVKLSALAPPAATPQPAALPAVQLTCHARAGMQVLQPRHISKVWQAGLPIDERRLFSVSVDFDGRAIIVS